MKKVTDPNILAQLNSDSSSTKVTDPNLLAQLNGQEATQQQAPSPQGMLQQAGNTVEQYWNKPFERNIAAPALGFAQGVANVPSDIMNLLNKTSQFGLPEQFKKNANGQERHFPSFNVAPHTLPSQAGEAASMVFNPAFTAKAPEAINALKTGASELGNLASNNPLAEKAINMVNAFKPGAEAEKLSEHLGQGAKTADQNMESLVKDIQNKHNEREAEAGIHFNHALDRAGNEKIYEKPNPLVTTKLDEEKDILGKIKDLKVGELGKAFENDPNFNNAHKLQSELGAWVGEFEKKPHKTTEELADLNKVRGIRNQLKNDISNFMERRDATSNIPIKPSYEKGSELYEKNVAHFLSDPKLRDIVRGGHTAVEDISSIFKTPHDIVNRKTGEVKLGPINRMMQDLPSESKNKILFDVIGGKSKNALDLLSKLKEAENKGFGKYFTPETKEIMNSLERKIENKNALGTLGKVAKYGTYGAAGIGALGLGAKSLYSGL